MRTKRRDFANLYQQQASDHRRRKTSESIIKSRRRTHQSRGSGERIECLQVFGADDVNQAMQNSDARISLSCDGTDAVCVCVCGVLYSVHAAVDLAKTPPKTKILERAGVGVRGKAAKER